MPSIPPFRIPWRVCCRALVALLLITAATAGGAAETWLIGRSEHFEMYSSASEKESRQILVALEQFRANFLGIFPLRGASEPRTTVTVFRSDSAFRPYKPLYKGKPKDVAGYFLSHPDEVTIAMTSDVPNEDSDPREVIYHEYVHLLLHVRDARYPLWLDEGLAEVFSTFKLVDGKVVYGQPKNSHVALLQRSTPLPLAKLFSVTHESPDYNEEDRAGIFYAESWAFTHFLLYGEDKSNVEKLGKFALHLAGGDEVEASFREAFGTDYKAQEDALRRYLDGGGYYKRGKPAVAQEIQITFRPATGIERDFALLNLRWRIHHDDDAAARALALLERDSTQARPHELLAAIAAQSDDPASAQEHWLQAAERNSDNPWVYVQLLREALKVYEGPAVLDVRLPTERIAPWREWAKRAWTLSPGSADAIELALRVEALAEKMDVRAINRTQGQVATMRDPTRALLALAIVHWRGKDLAGARNIIGVLAAQPRADMATRSAGNALRYRLPAVEETAAPATTASLGAVQNKGIALQSARTSDAAVFLDRILTERGTTAPRLTLEPLIVRPPAVDQADVWRRTDEIRRNATAGDADAMLEMAIAHACGSGVEFSPILATEWLQKAIDHGNTLAKAGLAPGKLDPELVARFLRQQKSPPAATTLPPLDEELKSRIDDAAAAAERHPPVAVCQATPRYPEALCRAGKSGEVLVRFTIRPDGHTDNIRAMQFSDSAFATASEECLRNWRFIPTIRDGKPTTTLAEILIRFEVSKPASAQP